MGTIIALLGGKGQLGWELGRALSPLGEVVALARYGDEDACGDFDRPDALRRALRRLSPQVIVNAAAYTDVERAEREPERAARVNVDGPALLAAEARGLDAWLVHYSTDYVFDGSGARPWREDDEPRPINVYGHTKWAGERAVRESGCRHLIVRTQWLYSRRRRNFLRTVLTAAAERNALEVVDDQTGAPTGADLVADVTAHLLRALPADGRSATFHVAARGETTWHGYARFAIERARREGWPLALTAEGIVPISSDARAGTARRPRNCRLSVDRVESALGLRMPDWRVGVERVLGEIGARSLERTTTGTTGTRAGVAE